MAKTAAQRGKGNRSKGATAEREFLKKLTEELEEIEFSGLPENGLARNLDQTREGGWDNNELLRFAMEIRRRESLSLGSWWKKVCEEAIPTDKIPAVIYRQSRQPWKIMVPFYFNIREFDAPCLMAQDIESITIDIGTFAKIIKEVYS